MTTESDGLAFLWMSALRVTESLDGDAMGFEVKDLEEFGKLYEAYMEKKRKEEEIQKENDEARFKEERRRKYLRKKLMNREARHWYEAKLKREFDEEYTGKKYGWEP